MGTLTSFTVSTVDGFYRGPNAELHGRDRDRSTVSTSHTPSKENPMKTTAHPTHQEPVAPGGSSLPGGYAAPEES